MKKRIGIFLLYDTKGIVYEYVEYLLSDIKKSLDELVIVSNGYLREESRVTLQKYSEKILERPNYGFDAAGWKEAMLDYCGMEYIRQFDELILFNDSFFGPFYPFQVIFDEMDGRETDFWGLTSHGPAPSAGNACPYGDRPAYIQTYFMGFRNSMLRDPSFEEYWAELPYYESFSDLVEKHGAVLTRHFEDLGFKWDVYSDTRDLESDNIKKNFSFHMFDSYDMVVNRKLPIIKRKCFITPKEHYLRYGLADSLFRTMEYIEHNTSYDTRMIWDYLLDKYNIYDLKQSLNLNYVLDTHCAAKTEVLHPTAVIAHLFYDDLFDYCLSYLQGLPEGVDLYITTSSEEKKELLTEMTREMGIPVQQISVVNNRGRELSALLVGCSGIPAKYEYLCFYHDKKSSQKEYLTVGSDFRRLLTENIFGTRAYIYNILNLFEENPRLGLLVPPNVYHGTYFSSSVDYWTICYDETRNVLRRLDLDDMILERQKPPVAIGTAYWCRVDALKPLFEETWEVEDFPKEPMRGDGTFSHALERCFPYVAQSQHYYTGTLMTTEYAATEIANFRYMLTTTQGAVRGLKGVTFSNFYNFYHSLRARRFVVSDKKKTLRQRIKSRYKKFKKRCKSVMPKPIWRTLRKMKAFIKRSGNK